jgi:hypothetical protein
LVSPRIGGTVTQKAAKQTRLLWLAPLLALFLAFAVSAYDDVPHSASAIREAYFLGTRRGGLTPDILASYTHWVPELKEGSCTSRVRLETPFLQVADYAGKAPNYSSQDAVKEFYNKQMVSRIYLDICYKPDAPLNAIKIKVIQNKGEIIPLSAETSPYVPRVGEHATLPPNGEQVRLEFKSSQIDSSSLTILVDTPDKQHAEVAFDLQALR